MCDNIDGMQYDGPSESEDSIKEQLRGCAEAIRTGTNFGDGCKIDIKTCMPLSKFLENIMDMALTIIELLIICGIHECKARRTNDLIISSFIYFDEITSRSSKKFKKKVKKENFFNDLATEVPMSGSDALLTYALVKYAFKAFYYKQTVKYYDPGFISECQWSKTVKKMFQAFVRLNRGSSCKHIQKAECLIKSTIEEYIQRVRRRSRKMTKVFAEGEGGNNQMSQIGARPQRQSITSCPICESMKECKDNIGKPHQPCDMDKWIAWLNTSPHPFAQPIFNPSCQQNHVVSGLKIQNACTTCPCPFPQSSEPYEHENEPLSPSSNSPAPASPNALNALINCMQPSNPCPCSNNPQPAENCYPTQMPCCTPPRPCSHQPCQQSNYPCHPIVQPQQQQTNNPMANKCSLNDSADKDKGCPGEKLNDACGPPSGSSKPINPCPKCAASNTQKCQSTNILWQTVQPNTNPCDKYLGNTQNCNIGNNTNGNDNALASTNVVTKCIPCISAYPKTCVEELKEPKKIHVPKCCPKKLPNKRCPCGTKGSKSGPKRK